MMIVLNHKMNLQKEDIEAYYQEMNDLSLKEDKLVICPSALYLPYFEGASYELGSQDVCAYEKGSHTGNISASQLASMKVSYTIVGHSERRKYEQETDEQIHHKMEQLFQVGIHPILCIGETMEEKNNQETLEKVIKQIHGACDGFTKEELSKVIFAYEPVWAIGTGKVPTNKEIEEVTSYLKQMLQEAYGIKGTVLYGGSINQSNITSLRGIPSIDGFLIGGFSLDPKGIKSALN